MHQRTLIPLALVLAGACAAAPHAARTEPPAQERGVRVADPRLPVLDAMTGELERNAKELKIGDNHAPYFIGYTLRDDHSFDLQARYGALFTDEEKHGRSVYVEVRVGSYQLDNSKAKPDGLFGTPNAATYISRKDAPLDGDMSALKAALWLSTDEKYKEALSDYLKMRGDRVYKPDEKEAPSFSHEPVVHSIQAPVAMAFDRARWRREVSRASALFKGTPEIFDNLVRVNATKEIRWITNTEGSKVLTEDVIYGLSIGAVARADDGMLLTHERSFYGRTQDELPSGANLDAEVERLASELKAVRTAPVMDPYTGPAILAPVATGVLFHEAIGHRLEGERQDDDESGRTFRGQVGVRVIPSFLSVYDDPNVADWEGTPLNGWYAYDDEAVRAQRADLIDHGILKGYLTSRAPVKDAPPESNGHGRAQGVKDPIARMGNLVVAADPESAQVVSRDELKQMLIAEAKRQHKPYGLIIEDISGGDTNTSSYGYQAFRGVPTLAYRVDVKTGKETLVRGIELVGTPLTVINKIVAASKETDVFNGYCGAESGFVPVSTVAPATLITEVELQRQPREAERAPVLPPPWAVKK